MELDKAFEFALILAWDDLTQASKLCSARVEYHCDPGIPLDNVQIWSSKERGHHELACDYWRESSPTHPRGARFRAGLSSATLAEVLEFILKNQDQFTRAADGCRSGLVVINPPTGEEQTGAALWMDGVVGTAIQVASGAD